MNDPINRIDPEGTDWIDVAENSIQFTAGAANSASFGLSNALIEASGQGWSLHKDSNAYKSGEYVALAVSALRLAYAGSAKVAAALATDARAASATRNSLKQVFRLGNHGSFKSFEQMLVEKSGNLKDIKSAAGKTNKGFNAWASGTLYTGSSANSGGSGGGAGGCR